MASSPGVLSAGDSAPRDHAAEYGDSLGCHTGEKVLLSPSGSGPGMLPNTLQEQDDPRATGLSFPEVGSDRPRTLVLIKGGRSSPPRPRGRVGGHGKVRGPAALCLIDPILQYLGFVPVVDGDFIPDDPVNLYANAADIDYIAGTNNMDGHLFAGIDMPAINKNKQTVTE